MNDTAAFLRGIDVLKGLRNETNISGREKHRKARVEIRYLEGNMLSARPAIDATMAASREPLPGFARHGGRAAYKKDARPLPKSVCTRPTQTVKIPFSAKASAE